MAPSLKRKPSVTDTDKAKRSKPSQDQPQQQQQRAFEPNAARSSASFSSLLQGGAGSAGSGAGEVAFPRGGGTTLSAAEVKAARSEGKREADAALGAGPGANGQRKSAKKPRVSTQGRDGHKKSSAAKGADQQESTTPAADTLRVEHLNYKRLIPGQRVLCSVVSVRALELIVSLPNQLLGHIPITSISSEFTRRLAEEAAQESDDDDDDDESDEDEESDLPELDDWFKPGQLLTAAVVNIKSADLNKKSLTGSRKEKIDEAVRWSRRLELSLDPVRVNEGVKKEDLVHGLVLPAAVKSVEDNGYILDIGLSDFSPFINFEQVKKVYGDEDLSVGQLLSIKVDKLEANGRTVSVSLASSGDTLMEPPSISGLLPGTLVHATVSEVLPHGLNLKFLGFFDATIDLYHIPLSATADLAKSFKVGKKLKGRILWSNASAQTGSQVFALTLLPHLVHPAHSTPLDPAILVQAFPAGRMLDGVQVQRVEPEFGLVCTIPGPQPTDPVVPAFVHLSRIADEHMQSVPPGSKWKAGTTHRARVVGFSQFDNLVQLSLQPSVINAAFFNVSDLEIGASVKGTVKSLTDKALFVNLEGSVDAVVWNTHISDIKLKHPERKYKPGVAVKGRVFSVDPVRARVSLTLKKSLLASDLPVIRDIAEAKVVQDVDAVVSKVKDNGAIVELFGGFKAFVPIGEVSDDYLKTLSGVLSEGQPVKIRILKVDVEGMQMVASMRHALEAPKKASKAEKKKTKEKEKNAWLAAQPYHRVEDLQELVESQQPIKGLVKNISAAGLFVAVSKDVTARVLIKEMFDEYVKDWQAKFETGQEVEGRITSIDVVKSQVEMSLRRNARATKATPAAEVGLEAFKVGQIVRAFVKSIQAFGVFLRIEDSRISGLCHRSEVRDNAGEDWAKEVRLGDDVSALITEIDLEKQRISFSMRKSRIHKASDAITAAREENGSEVDTDDGADDDLDIILDAQRAAEEASESEESDVDLARDAEADSDQEDTEMGPLPSTSASALNIGSSFNWQGLAAADVNQDSDDDEAAADTTSIAPAASTSKLSGNHSSINFAEDKTAELDSRSPTSVADFERLLLGAPNSSLLWIQFMSFYAQASDLPAARATAKKALRTINYRETEEKQNVWLAWLNLENLVGTEESLDETFKEAAQVNDAKTIHLHLLRLLEQAKKYEKAEEVWQETVKKFSQDPVVWQRFAQYYFRRGQLEAARSLLPRSLKSLPKNQHLDQTAKFAQMEFKQADPERGRTIFEGILDSHPKRLDLLNVYIDQETKTGNVPAARALYKRGLSQKSLSSKKAKFLLKKFLTFEKDYGTKAGVEAVKKLAAEWVAEHAKGQSRDEED